MSESKDLIMSIIDGDIQDIKVEKEDINDRKLTIKEIYEIENEHWFYKYRNAMLKRMLKMHIKGEDLKIANIGVLTGTLAKYIESFGEITHIDSNISHIKFVQSEHNLNVEYGELPWMIPLEDHSMDYIIMLNYLEYLDNDFWSLDNINKKLKKSGKLILSTLANKNLYGLNDEVYGVKRRYTKANLTKMLKENGFNIDYFTYYESFSSLKQSLKLLKDKLFEEEEIYLNKVPVNNDEIYTLSKIDLDTIKDKPLLHGNQMFFVCSKMSESEQEDFLKKDNNSFLKKLINFKK